MYLYVIIQSFLNFPANPRISRAEQIRGIRGNFEILKFF